ncbi:hypothetical protein OH77DRAFT_578435 [Trametes cingulata]|nr:hypothetical protein OH77DRAFT_578435 [Trametes cingulata]
MAYCSDSRPASRSPVHVSDRPTTTAPLRCLLVSIQRPAALYGFEGWHERRRMIHPAFASNCVNREPTRCCRRADNTFAICQSHMAHALLQSPGRWGNFVELVSGQSGYSWRRPPLLPHLPAPWTWAGDLPTASSPVETDRPSQLLRASYPSERRLPGAPSRGRNLKSQGRDALRGLSRPPLPLERGNVAFQSVLS